MFKNPLFWYGNMACAVLGWLFVFGGLLCPFNPGSLKAVWTVIALVWTVGHPLELFISIPIAKKAGVSKGKAIVKTIIFGFTWWLPLKKGVFTQ